MIIVLQCCGMEVTGNGPSNLMCLCPAVIIGSFLKWRYVNIYLLLNLELFRPVVWDKQQCCQILVIYYMRCIQLATALLRVG